VVLVEGGAQRAKTRGRCENAAPLLEFRQGAMSTPAACGLCAQPFGVFVARFRCHKCSKDVCRVGDQGAGAGPRAWYPAHRAPLPLRSAGDFLVCLPCLRGCTYVGVGAPSPSRTACAPHCFMHLFYTCLRSVPSPRWTRLAGSAPAASPRPVAPPSPRGTAVGGRAWESRPPRLPVPAPACRPPLRRPCRALRR